MRIIQSRSFANKVKRFTREEKLILDRHVRDIRDHPTIGQPKKGDLRGVCIHKFTIHTMPYLLSYRVAGDALELIMIGPHENYYRDLITYLKNR